MLVSVFLPGGLDLLDTLLPLNQEGPLHDLRGAVTPAEPALLGNGLAPAPRADQGPQQRHQGPLRPRPDRLPARHRLRQPQPVALRLARVLGDRHGLPAVGVRLARPLAGPPRLARQPAAGPERRLRPLADAEVRQRAGRLDLQRRRRAVVDVVGLGRLGRRRRPGLRGDRRLARRTTPGPQSAARAARLAHKVSEQLAPFRRKDDRSPDPLAGPVAYPEDNDTADRLKTLAGLLAQPLGIRVATVDADGEFDTHEGQAATLTRDLGAVGEALATFQADLEQRGIADRVLTFVWSEFGRRPEANKSARHRPRRRRRRLGPGPARARRDPHRVPVADRSGSGEEPQGDRRLPPRLRLAAGPVAGHRPGRGHPRRRRSSARSGWCAPDVRRAPQRSRPPRRSASASASTRSPIYRPRVQARPAQAQRPQPGRGRARPRRQARREARRRAWPRSSSPAPPPRCA